MSRVRVGLIDFQYAMQKYGYVAYDNSDLSAKVVYTDGTLTQWVQVEPSGSITRREHGVVDGIDTATDVESAVQIVVKWLRAYEIRAAAGHLSRLLSLYVPNTVAHYAIEDAKRPLRVLAEDISVEHVHGGIL